MQIDLFAVTTGVAASFRFKHLFLCESLVFNVGDDANSWLEFFYPALKPWVHYIPLRDDMVDAELKIRWAMDPRNEAAVRKIARSGFELIRDHLRNEDVKEYWR
jgi:protein glucosyltransferase|eukprot:COSAG02_NODE_4282_length_5550_cov_40.147814_3_plen_104_part_00